MTIAATTTANQASVESEIKETARQLKDDGRGIAQDLRNDAEDYAETQKDHAAARVGTIAEMLRDTSGKLRNKEETTVAGLTETAAEQLDRVSRALREKNVRTMFAEASDLARGHPAIFLGGAVALGFVAGRFLRASSEHAHDNQDDGFSTASGV